jgi:hypothetical protein
MDGPDRTEEGLGLITPIGLESEPAAFGSRHFFYPLTTFDLGSRFTRTQLMTSTNAILQYRRYHHSLHIPDKLAHKKWRYWRRRRRKRRPGDDDHLARTKELLPLAFVIIPTDRKQQTQHRPLSNKNEK